LARYVQRKVQAKLVLMADRLACSFDLSGAPHDVIMAVLGHMDLQQRFICALVCSDWAKAAAAAATNAIVENGVKHPRQLQQWLNKHGSHVETLQLSKCSCTLDRLPCAQLQDLLLHIVTQNIKLILGSGVWSDIATATKFTSVQLKAVSTTVASVLTALPDLQQLTWRDVLCGHEGELSDSRILQHDKAHESRASV